MLRSLAVSAMMTSNLEKITEHDKRADGIVKAMLEHSRGSSAERRMVDLNAVIGRHGTSPTTAPERRIRVSTSRWNAISARHPADRGQPAGHDAGVPEHLQQRVLRGHAAGA